MRRTNRTTPEAPHPLLEFTVGLITQGLAYPEIEKSLLDKGLTQAQAETLAAQALNRQAEQQAGGDGKIRREITRGAGIFNMFTGVVICGIAGAIAISSFTTTEGDIEITLLVSPVIVYGLFRFITGLWQMFERY
ncbi:MAG: hypothetical protein H7Y09_01630 [Chitinophagaceae bacterium]|nr:hypothetical protein [Anaerolineae bacterium]